MCFTPNLEHQAVTSIIPDGNEADTIRGCDWPDVGSIPRSLSDQAYLNLPSLFPSTTFTFSLLDNK